MIPNPAHTGLFKKPWADLEVDYLSSVVSQDLTYFDGSWSGQITCDAVGGSPSFSKSINFELNRGAFEHERGYKKSNGYSRWKAKIKPNGKVSLKGKYYWNEWKSISISGQIGVDPKNPINEILWLKGIRGPRWCEGQLDRKLPLSGIKALAERLPLLADKLREREKKAAVNVTASTEKKASPQIKLKQKLKQEEARRIAKLEAERKRKEEDAQRIAQMQAERKRKEEQARRIAQTESERKREEQETLRLANLAAQEAERKIKEEQARRIAELEAERKRKKKEALQRAAREAERKRKEQKAKLLAREETQKDVIPPQIVIFSHDTSRAISVVWKQKKINIKGQATDKSGIVEVIVNNKEARLDEKGNFDVDIYLGMGKNKIVVRAMDTFENVADKTFTITRSASGVSKADAVSKIASGRYVALVIGNNNYRHIRPLETARKDARDIGQTLKNKYGFEVRLLVDATRNDIVRAINTIRKSLKENDSLLIYYAGHGEFDKTANKAYWLPVDARKDDDTNWILADRITSNIRRISSKHILVVADSCYSGTFTRRAVTDLSSSQARDRYLKKMQAKNSRTLLASGGNEPVSDIGGKGHSVFAAALLQGLKQMEKNTFSAEELFYDHIKERVAGNADQTPEYNIIRNSGHDGGDFIFKRIKNSN
jgi:hypothetical protein